MGGYIKLGVFKTWGPKGPTMGPPGPPWDPNGTHPGIPMAPPLLGPHRVAHRRPYSVSFEYTLKLCKRVKTKSIKNRKIKNI